MLTVADDLLKNDGKKFIDMMERLAERRMAREEEASYVAAGYRHPNSMPGHNHGPPLDEEDYDEEEAEEDYASEEGAYDEEAELVSLEAPLTRPVG